MLLVNCVILSVSSSKASTTRT